LIFVSLEYGLLLLATFASYWLLPARLAPSVLLAASVVFYAHWSVPYLALVSAAIAVGYLAARAIATARERGSGGLVASPRVIVSLCVTALLGMLAVFKYGDFFLGLWDDATGAQRSESLGIVLPLAISFYTFQTLGYVIDVYRGAQPERSLLRFSVFVGFFPQLIAGPIVRAHELLPQLATRPAFDAPRVLSGLEWIAYGIVKKTVFADNLAVLVDQVFRPGTSAGGLDVVIATLAFGAQIYFDFSGYTDIARGSARLLGIELPVNFRSPYLARSLTEFWRRWHITLSSWLRDYLYIPLGGNRGSLPATYRNLMLTMTLGGLWHGASWTFLLWGAYHGAFLALERAFRDRGLRVTALAPLGRFLALPLTFVAVQIGWAIFRAGDFATLAALGRRVASAPLETAPFLDSFAYLPLIVAAYALHAASAWLRSRESTGELLARPWVAAPALAAAFVLVATLGGASSAFIYFQF